MYTNSSEVRTIVKNLNDSASKVKALEVVIFQLQAKLDDQVNVAWINNEVQGSNEIQRKAFAASMFPELRQEIRHYTVQLMFAKSTKDNLENEWSMVRKLIDLQANEIKVGEAIDRFPELKDANFTLEPETEEARQLRVGGEFPITEEPEQTLGDICDLDEDHPVDIEAEVREKILKDLQETEYIESELSQAKIDERDRELEHEQELSEAEAQAELESAERDREEYEMAQLEAIAEEFASQHDDDPSPYAGDYSEE